MTPLYILFNVFFFVRGLTLPSETVAPVSSAQALLEAQRQYALNLLATKDVQTVVEVLQQQTGASEAEVRAFLERLRAAA